MTNFDASYYDSYDMYSHAGAHIKLLFKQSFNFLYS